MIAAPTITGLTTLLLLLLLSLSVGAPASTSLNSKSHWKLHLGKLHSTDVSVFRAEGAVAAIAEMAKNSFQRTKQTKVGGQEVLGRGGWAVWVVKT